MIADPLCPRRRAWPRRPPTSARARAGTPAPMEQMPAMTVQHGRVSHLEHRVGGHEPKTALSATLVERGVEECTGSGAPVVMRARSRPRSPLNITIARATPPRQIQRRGIHTTAIAIEATVPATVTMFGWLRRRDPGEGVKRFLCDRAAVISQHHSPTTRTRAARARSSSPAQLSAR